GRSVAHLGWAHGQRVWNLHPDGGFAGDGRSPWSRMRSRRSSASGSGRGTADMRALVYGCLGAAYKASLGASSTREPRYMTPMTSEMCRTTARSWAMTRSEIGRAHV